jgi:hypothetical protein
VEQVGVARFLLPGGPIRLKPPLVEVPRRRENQGGPGSVRLATRPSRQQSVRQGSRWAGTSTTVDRQERNRERLYEARLKANSEAVTEHLEKLGILPRARRLPPNPDGPGDKARRVLLPLP